MNDPKEYKGWSGIFNRIYNKKIEDDFKDSLTRSIYDESYITCFSISKKVTQLPGLASDKQGWCHPRMWAQYGEGHSDVCLVFHKENLINQAKKIFGKQNVSAGRIRYKTSDEIWNSISDLDGSCGEIGKIVNAYIKKI